MVIVEGTDLVGKTAFCEALLKVFYTKGRPLIPQHFGLLEDSWDFEHDYIKFMNDRVVMDRFIMSEVVYGHVVRNHSRITPEVYRRLDAHLRNIGSVTVVIVATQEWLTRQLQEKYHTRDEMFKAEQILKVNTGFKSLVTDFISKDHMYVNQYMCDCDFVCQVTEKAGDHFGYMPSNNAELINEVVELWERRQKLRKGNYNAGTGRKNMAQVKDVHTHR